MAELGIPTILRTLTDLGATWPRGRTPRQILAAAARAGLLAPEDVDGLVATYQRVRFQGGALDQDEQAHFGRVVDNLVESAGRQAEAIAQINRALAAPEPSLANTPPESLRDPQPAVPPPADLPDAEDRSEQPKTSPGRWLVWLAVVLWGVGAFAAGVGWMVWRADDTPSTTGDPPPALREPTPDDWYQRAVQALDRGDEGGAAVSYRHVLAYLPDHTMTANNLAWLLLTTENPELHDPVEAQFWAEQAYARDQGPVISDTLAEARFQNGRVREAVRLAVSAAAHAPDDAWHYQRQLVRFVGAQLSGALPTYHGIAARLRWALGQLIPAD